MVRCEKQCRIVSTLFASYADLLLLKRARMEDVHSSAKVVRQIGENITIILFF